MLWFRKRVPPNAALTWGVFASLPLLLVIGRQANVFVSDNYLLVPLLGFAILVALTFNYSRLVKTITILLVLSFTASSVSISLSYGSQSALWKRAYQIEKTPFVISQMASISFDEGHYDEALYFALLLKEYNVGPVALELVGRFVYNRPDWDWEKKKTFLEAQSKGITVSPLFQYTLGMTYTQVGQLQKGYELMLGTASKANELSDLKEEVAARTSALCEVLAQPNCGALKATFQRSANQSIYPWSEEKFQSHLNQLKNNEN
jgi:hypothetical protein